jgi:hypothetical protein
MTRRRPLSGNGMRRGIMELWTTYNEDTDRYEVRGNDPQTGEQVVYFTSADARTAWEWLVENR